ncbi:DUF421 domain-containing protein [Holzapfeliella sp. JNUCC 80]
MVNYVDIGLKLTLAFATVILQINVFGKGNLAPSNAVDQLQNYVLGGVIGGMLYSKDVTLLQFFIVLLVWSFIVSFVKLLTNHSRFFKRVIDGSPVTVIKNGQINVEVLNSIGLSAHDLSFKLRSTGAFDIRKVKRGVVEQNGQLTVTQVGDESIKYPIIMDGQIDEDALDVINRDEDWLMRQLKLRGYELNQIYMANYLSHKIVIFPYSGIGDEDDEKSEHDEKKADEESKSDK